MEQDLFLITPLNLAEWKAVVYLSLPVILIDEIFVSCFHSIYLYQF
jgi:hypothetical protein